MPPRRVVYWIEDPASFLELPAHFDRCDDCVAVTPELTPAFIKTGYRIGAFPWFEENQEFFWFSPLKRCVIRPSEVHIPHALRKKLRQLSRSEPGPDFSIELDTSTDEIIGRCATIRRPNQSGTWITDDYIRTYGELAQEGIVHSIGVYCGTELVGGLWGTSFGGVFTGESMFHTRPDASKIAFAALVALCQKLNISLIDCQQATDHMLRFGATLLDRPSFTHAVLELTQSGTRPWQSLSGTIPLTFLSE